MSMQENQHKDSFYKLMMFSICETGESICGIESVASAIEPSEAL